jgi:hypothetical protein
MDKIIFDNMLRGFPADEKFMRMVDYNRLALLDTCNGILGTEPVILRGAEISQRVVGEKTQIMISSGILWTGNDLVKIKQSHVSTVVPEGVYIKIVTTAEKGTFHDGAEYDAYERSEGILASTEDGEPPAGKTIYLYSLRRINICQSVVSDIEVSRLRGTEGRIRGTLKQTVYSDNRTNICGMIYFEEFDLPELAQMNQGIKVAVLSSHNTDITQLKTAAEAAYPATITTYHQKDGDLATLFFTHNFVTINNTGVLRVHIPYEKIGDLGLPNAKISCAVAVDFTYNSGK